MNNGFYVHSSSIVHIYLYTHLYILLDIIYKVSSLDVVHG